MEQENKISFWKKIKISIFGLEEYQKLAVQKVGSSIGYLAKLMFNFCFPYFTCDYMELWKSCESGKFLYRK